MGMCRKKFKNFDCIDCQVLAFKVEENCFFSLCCTMSSNFESSKLEFFVLQIFNVKKLNWKSRGGKTLSIFLKKNEVNSSKMELKHVNPNGEIVVVRNLNQMDIFILEI